MKFKKIILFMILCIITTVKVNAASLSVTANSTVTVGSNVSVRISGGTGKVGIGAAGIKKTDEEYSYMILGDENGQEVVFTFHPGKPVTPSMIEAKDIPHGTLLTLAETKSLGFEKVKFITNEMQKGFDKPTASRRESSGPSK